jgi:hypothetical protein
MKRALVIYESMYGNTEQIARAIGDGLAERMTVDVVEVGTARTTLAPDVWLIVVGGPTHAFGMSRPGTREAAAKEAESTLVSSGIGVREWLEGLEPPAELPVAAAYDTHVDHPKLLRHVGSAAAAITKRLEKLGIETVAEPEHFWVAGTQGPLRDGELQRAHAFGRSLADRAKVTTTTTLGSAGYSPQSRRGLQALRPRWEDHKVVAGLPRLAGCRPRRAPPEQQRLKLPTRHHSPRKPARTARYRYRYAVLPNTRGKAPAVQWPRTRVGMILIGTE